MFLDGEFAVTDSNHNDATKQVDEKRRSALLGMGKAMAYVPPLVATFAMGGMSIREAHAYTVNQTNQL